MDDEQESRYILIEPMWKDFVKDCSELLEGDIMLRLHIKWQNIENPTLVERQYYKSCWGKKHTDIHIIRVYDILKKQKKRIGKKRLEEQAKELMDRLDYNIVRDVRELRKKYHDLIQSHPWICNEMIIETVYPEFIHREVEQIEKNKKTKNKKYPKHQRVFVSEVLKFSDSVEVNKSPVSAVYTK
jgi:tRNA U34 5-carboxymethylaminomethyl modifying enzyme MnmG/GidA